MLSQPHQDSASSSHCNTELCLSSEVQHHLLPAASNNNNNSNSSTRMIFKIDHSEFTTHTHRLLRSDSPRMCYSEEGKAHNRNALHWGQRKLLLSEIEFLTQYSQPGDIVIYAGAAPGNHLLYLTQKLFPQLTFIFIDPNKFNEKLSSLPNVKILQEYFTVSMAEEFAQLKNQMVESKKLMQDNSNNTNLNNILFMSDIRTADPSIMSLEESDKCIIEDLQLQKTWIHTLQPRFSMVKFRLPYSEGKTKYYSGNIFLPVWGRKWTTECRLVISEKDVELGNEIEYDNIEHAEQMFYFNNVTRFEYIYPHDIIGKSEGVDNCYDCRSEIHILTMFLNKFPNMKQSIRQDWNQISKRTAKGSSSTSNDSAPSTAIGSSNNNTNNTLMISIDPSQYMDSSHFIGQWMFEISMQISPNKRSLCHVLDSSQFIFYPTVHLLPQQQDSKEWLEMRNMILQRTSEFSKLIYGSQQIPFNIDNRRRRPVSIIQDENDHQGFRHPQAEEEESLISSSTMTSTKRKKRRKHKKRNKKTKPLDEEMESQHLDSHHDNTTGVAAETTCNDGDEEDSVSQQQQPSSSSLM
ncbi:hypothetical protein C9374_007180 [Naegleria lovaniensis]|uniref:Cap-specific mRNA (nucleoside-2'-O-)-methyltransferase n=1 Tax=Naegleria lovaniensis TaxID=51637 RepID=A0AA88H4Y7_NAELO|nr:uncharacterized protein C9374_007180 [Naegleria lovaniensis]KAG2393649.1 hypothetical protein C9374_007180 [Naegleria lovaniensis]